METTATWAGWRIIDQKIQNKSAVIKVKSPEYSYYVWARGERGVEINYLDSAINPRRISVPSSDWPEILRFLHYKLDGTPNFNELFG